MQFTLMFILLFLIFFIIKILLLKSTPSETAAGAIVMGCGIFINGAMKNIPLLENKAGKILTTSLLIIWIFIAASFIESAIKKTINEIHFKGAIKSFGVGTWVAGTSVCGIAIFQRIHELDTFARVMFWGNLALWALYLAICIRNYGAIFGQGLYSKVHGILLLSTVSTQSIVVFGNTIFGEKFPKLVSSSLIYLGIALYILAFILIIRKYFFSKEWNLEDGWTNTNCILHGAMSITGLASAVSGAINYNLVLFIWLWILLWFIIVEFIEVLRAIKRVNKYGFIKGVAVYNVTQWSRIFTFGMLYTFTMKFNLSLPTLTSKFLFSIQNFILRSGTWIMVLILLYEGVLYFIYQSKNRLGKSA
ncbi:hypothetical protein [Clostridium sp. YIM B02551]|uniref:hypothetical protein n=1 Tax=Clostridium sp. YIM B02551 TaxID=2910679 RepID=UPI001EEA11C6|nr:hypothetical protein [Clostridium sp. YIM B02551]